MSKTKKTTKPLSPKPVVEQVDTAFVVREALDDQQEPLAPITIEGAGGSKAPAAAAAAMPTKPLAPLASLWPDPAPATAPPLPKPPAKSVQPTSPEKSALLAQASKPPASKPVTITFALLRPDAKGVSLCGDFNGWSPTATPMKRQAGGPWETTIVLVPGGYQYKFLVDGEWLLDPAAKRSVPNQFGSLNSVLEVRA